MFSWLSRSVILGTWLKYEDAKIHSPVLNLYLTGTISICEGVQHKNTYYMYKLMYIVKKKYVFCFIAVCIYRYVITFGLRSEYDVLGHYFIFMIVLPSINKFNMT